MLMIIHNNNDNDNNNNDDIDNNNFTEIWFNKNGDQLQIFGRQTQYLVGYKHLIFWAGCEDAVYQGPQD